MVFQRGYRKHPTYNESTNCVIRGTNTLSTARYSSRMRWKYSFSAAASPEVFALLNVCSAWKRYKSRGLSGCLLPVEDVLLFLGEVGALVTCSLSSSGTNAKSIGEEMFTRSNSTVLSGRNTSISILAGALEVSVVMYSGSNG